MKVCPGCGVEKELSEFYKRRGNKPGSYCRSCSRSYQYAWRMRNTDRQRAYRRKTIYGLTPEEQDRLPDECAICGSTEDLHIDHDHTTGDFRGVLCRDHNIGLGRFQDDPVLLMRAADYIIEHLRTSGR